MNLDDEVMMAKSADEILGFEYDWLASDADGFVGFFSTAGGGYAPDLFLADTEAHEAAILAVLASPAVASARFVPRVPYGCDNVWQLMAERGIYAFDSDAHGADYCQVAAPDHAAHLEKLPLAARVVVRLLAFPNLRFASLPNIPQHLLRGVP